LLIASSEMNKILVFLRYSLLRYGKIDEKLRGWNWHEPPVEPPSHEIRLSVSEIAYRYCRSMRDIYLRRVERIRASPSIAMIEGKIYHEVIKQVSISAKKHIYQEDVSSGDDLFLVLAQEGDKLVEYIVRRNLGRVSNHDETDKILLKARRLWRFLALQIASRYDILRSKYGDLSLDSIAHLATVYIVERIVDGSRIGLSSRLLVDALEPGNILVELKTGREECFHRIALAGYALALESDDNIPVDFGLLIYVQLNDHIMPRIRVKAVLIDDELRRDFLDLRDQAMTIVLNEKDPGLPDRCHPQCPYLSICRGGPS